MDEDEDVILHEDMGRGDWDALLCLGWVGRRLFTGSYFVPREKRYYYKSNLFRHVIYDCESTSYCSLENVVPPTGTRREAYLCRFNPTYKQTFIPGVPMLHTAELENQHLKRDIQNGLLCRRF
jgi:hypothetical protein